MPDRYLKKPIREYRQHEMKYNDMITPKSKVEKIVDIKKSTKEDKKYDAIIRNNVTGRERVVSFGARYPDGSAFSQFKDRIGLYSKYDHGDPDRRARYLARHAKEKDFDAKGRYTASLLARFFLW